MQLFKKVFLIIFILQLSLFIKCLNIEDNIYIHSLCVKKHRLDYVKYATCFLNGEPCIVKCRSDFDQCYKSMGGNAYGSQLCSDDFSKCREKCPI